MDTYEAIRDELAALRIKLRAEESGLANLNAKYNGLSISAADGDEEAAAEAVAIHSRAEQIKVKINGLKLLITQRETAKAVLDQAIMADAEARWKEDAKTKWKAIVSQCHEARTKVERLKKEVDVLEKEAEDAQELFEHAQARLDEHRSTPADPLGLSPSELDRARRLDAKLLAACNQALRERNDANATKGSRRLEWQAAGREMERLALAARLNCPQDVAKARAKAPATIGEALQTAQ